MKHKALIVTNDDAILAVIDDTLASIDHRHERATNQRDARRLVETRNYSYVLLDLEIPVRQKGKFVDRVYGYHLLEDVQYIKGKGRLPVIVVDSEADCLNYVVRYLEKGASDFVAKPFNGRTLAKVIRRVLNSRNCDGFVWQCFGATSPASPKYPFKGGGLVFVRDHRGSEWVELCGIRIISDKGFGVSIRLLKALARKDSSGRYVRLSGEDLADALDALGGVGTITSSVQTLRRNIFARLRKHLNCECREGDVIAHDTQGYYLREWITVRSEEREAGGGNVLGRVPHDVPGTPRCDVPGVPDHDDVPDGSPLNERQSWAIKQLQRGVELQRAAIQKQFGVHEKTAKRDLADLSRRGEVEFVGLGRRGYYRLIKRLTDTCVRDCRA